MTNNELWAGLFIAFLFVGMLACLEIGRSLGRHSPPQQEGKEGLSIIEGAIFALLGLLVAFTFSGAAERFENRRHLIVEEANDIGTAYLRVDLLPPQSQPEIRELFREYVDSRLDTYSHASNGALARQHFARSQDLQAQIWQKSVVAAAQTNNTAASMLLLPALNSMFDITTVRIASTEDHPPNIIFGMLALIALATSLMAGFEMAGATSRSWLHILGYAFILSVAVYVIVDLEFPRLGMIRVDAFDHYLGDVRATMK